LSKLDIFKLENTFIIKKSGEDNDFFFTTSDSFIIPSFNFFSILKFMLFRDFISPKALEGLLDEYRDAHSG
jgi:hypothetical protein